MLFISKSFFKKIITTTLKKLASRGSNFKDLIAIIGPCIDKRNYEVKKDFFNKFIKQEKSNKKFFSIKNNKFYFSLKNYIKDEFLKLGVKNIELIQKDTYISSNDFFSARRSIKNKLHDYGRNISVIMIK